MVGLFVLAATACRQEKVESLIDVPLPPDLAACEDQYEDGKLVDYSSEGDFAKACQDAGELVTPVPTDLSCSDGRRLLFNDYAWGYQNDAMTLFDPEEPVHMPPEDEIMSCLRQDGEGADTESE